MNSVSIIGRLVRDPEARQTQSGISTSRFTVAVRRDRKNAHGKYDSDFINCIAWRATADFVNRYMAKGRLVAVTGSIQTGSYTDKNGVKKYTFDVVADGVEALDRAADAPAAQTEQGNAQSDFQDVTDEVSDELPFE